MTKDLYEVLGVDRDADAKALKSAFRKKAMQYHPDRNPGDKNAETQFKAVNEAYEILKDPAKRADYEQYGDVEYAGRARGASPDADSEPSADMNNGFNDAADPFDTQNILDEIAAQIRRAEELKLGLEEAERSAQKRVSRTIADLESPLLDRAVAAENQNDWLVAAMRFAVVQVGHWYQQNVVALEAALADENSPQSLANARHKQAMETIQTGCKKRGTIYWFMDKELKNLRDGLRTHLGKKRQTDVANFLHFFAGSLDAGNYETAQAELVGIIGSGKETTLSIFNKQGKNGDAIIKSAQRIIDAHKKEARLNQRLKNDIGYQKIGLASASLPGFTLLEPCRIPTGIHTKSLNLNGVLAHLPNIENIDLSSVASLKDRPLVREFLEAFAGQGALKAIYERDHVFASFNGDTYAELEAALNAETNNLTSGLKNLDDLREEGVISGYSQPIKDELDRVMGIETTGLAYEQLVQLNAQLMTKLFDLEGQVGVEMQEIAYRENDLHARANGASPNRAQTRRPGETARPAAFTA